MPRRLALAPLLLLAVLAPARAAVVVTDLSADPLTLLPSASGVLAFQLGLEGPASAALVPGATVSAGDSYYFDYVSSLAGWQLTTTLSTAQSDTSGTLSGFPAVTLFAAGAPLTGTPNFYGLLTSGPSGAWSAPGTQGYVGLAPESGGYEGWALVSYNADQSLTLYAFAVDTMPGESLLAGQTAVPEPGATTLWVGLAATLGVMTRWGRRHPAVRLRIPAQSD